MKRTKIILDNKEFDMVLDLRSAILFKELQGQNIFHGVEIIASEQDISTIVNLLCATIRDNKGKPIKKEFILNLDMLENIPTIMESLKKLLAKEVEVEEE